MKKIILIFLIASVVSCSKSSKNSPPQEEETFYLEGSVVKIFNMLMPKAHALDTNFAILLLGEPGDTGSLPEESIGVNCPSDRCAFLIGSGERMGEKSFLPPKLKLISYAPVVDGKFTFAMKKGDNPLYEGQSSSGSNPLFKGLSIYKVVVRGWDNVAKLPLAKSSADREIVLSNDEIGALVGREKGEGAKIEVTPETTVSARRRTEVLKSNRAESSLLETLKEAFGSAGESVRDVSLRLVSLIMGGDSEEKDLLTSILNNPVAMEKDLMVSQKFVIDLKKRIEESPLSSQSPGDLLDSLIEINFHIRSIRIGQTNQMAKYPLTALLESSEGYLIEMESLRSLRSSLDSSPNDSRLMGLVAAQELKMEGLTDSILDSCQPLKILRESQFSINDLESIKVDVVLEGSQYDDLRDQLEEEVLPLELEEVIENRPRSLMTSACAAATDFNTTRSNRQR